MAKLTTKERAEKYLAANNAILVFSTSDGFLFGLERHAQGHAKTLKDKTITKHSKKVEDIKVKDIKVVQDKKFNDQSVKEITTALQKITDVKLIEDYLDEETRSSQPRSTAVEAFEARIDELKKSE